MRIQLDYFNKSLDSAMVNEYEKVTFIHGVGNGVLKKMRLLRLWKITKAPQTEWLR